jgi:hypothetical protein
LLPAVTLNSHYGSIQDVKRHVIDQLDAKEKDKGDSFKWLWIKDMARSKVKNKLAYSPAMAHGDVGQQERTLHPDARSEVDRDA